MRRPLTFILVLLALSVALTAPAGANDHREFLYRGEIERDVAKSVGAKFGVAARRYIEKEGHTLECSPERVAKQVSCNWDIAYGAVNGRLKDKIVLEAETELWTEPCGGASAAKYCWESRSSATFATASCLHASHSVAQCSVTWRWTY